MKNPATKNVARKFNTLENARKFCYGCHQPHRIIRPEDSLFWFVVTPADANRLVKQGAVMFK